MLLFFDQNFDLESVKCDRFHEVALPKLCAVESFEFAEMLFQNDGAGEIQGLTELMQDWRPSL